MQDIYRKFKNWKPSPCDKAGYRLKNREEWLVVGERNRDSDCLTNSNFDVMLKKLGGEGKSVEMHSFGHWACGWVECIILDPTDKDKVSIVQQLSRAINEYPVLDDQNYSSIIEDYVEGSWESLSLAERVEELQLHGDSIFAARAITKLHQRAPKTYRSLMETTG